MKLTKGVWAIIVIVLAILIDQILKIWVKTNMYLGQDFEIFSWFHIRFVENNGIAMGIEIMDKLYMTIFRIIATIAIAYYLFLLIKRRFSLGYIICVALIFSGAVGNIIDCVFYGHFFSESTPFHIASFLPSGEGYADWMHGRVVDMFYFPLFSFTWPDWIPGIGGQDFEFFRYIFNFADAWISIGIITLILFYRKTFSDSFEKQKSIEEQ